MRGLGVAGSWGCGVVRGDVCLAYHVEVVAGRARPRRVVRGVGAEKPPRGVSEGEHCGVGEPGLADPAKPDPAKVACAIAVVEPELLCGRRKGGWVVPEIVLGWCVRSVREPAVVLHKRREPSTASGCKHQSAPDKHWTLGRAQHTTWKARRRARKYVRNGRTQFSWPYGDEGVQGVPAVAEPVQRVLDVRAVLPPPPAGQEPEGIPRRDRGGAGEPRHRGGAGRERRRREQVQIDPVRRCRPVLKWVRGVGG